MTEPTPSTYPWPARWTQLAQAVGTRPTDHVALALSGGADSVLLLHLLARSVPRPRVIAVHVDHGLRGSESQEDAAFCARACARAGIPFALKRVELDDPEGANLEARAREERYRALVEEASSQNISTIVTGHHDDDALETLLMRMMRGTHLAGLSGPKAQRVLRVGSGQVQPMRVIRPLRSMRREEVRRILRDHGIEWREDSSNFSERFTRNRVRHGLLPQIDETCGREGIENLRAFASAVENLEEELAARTAHLTWSAPLHAAARHAADAAQLGGTLERAALDRLAPPLKRRALWRLLSEGTGEAPSRAMLAELTADLEAGTNTRRALGGGWTLLLRADRLHLIPPGGVPLTRAIEERKLVSEDEEVGQRLELPGSIELEDGREIHAKTVELAPGTRAPRSAIEVELDASDLPATLVVRFARPGDRFHPLGAPGSRPLVRFLADAGIPREERGYVPLVFAGNELIWVAGVRPCESRRVTPATRVRLRLRLSGAALPA